MSEKSEIRYPPIFTEIHDMIKGIRKLSGIIKDAAGVSLILGPFTMFTWILLSWTWLAVRDFDLSGIGIIPVVLAVLVLILGFKLIDHGVRTYNFAKEWEQRYTKLLELEQKMASDLGITVEE